LGNELCDSETVRKQDVYLLALLRNIEIGPIFWCWLYHAAAFPLRMKLP